MTSPAIALPFVRIRIDHPASPAIGQSCRVGAAVGIHTYDPIYEVTRRDRNQDAWRLMAPKYRDPLPGAAATGWARPPLHRRDHQLTGPSPHHAPLFIRHRPHGLGTGRNTPLHVRLPRRPRSPSHDDRER